ncbi:MAG: serpin family protein [Deferribacteres bacterium]|nr:serpin family protein [candidate division KSB1 bacterium]MCB9504453.1 serpin family protein [Deferribacteres bacterium]
MKKSLFPTLGMVLLSAVACNEQSIAPDNDNPTNARELSATEKVLVSKGNDFGLTIFKKMAEAESDENLFISSLSISIALGMTLNGANGETKTAMENTLGFAALSSEDINQSYRDLIDLLTGLDAKVEFNIANSIWSREGMPFLESFYNTNKSYFDAECRSLNFADPQTLEIINGWISDKTNGKIEDMLDYIPPDAVMYLINAIYFNGTWTYAFDEERTADHLFTDNNGQYLTCKMMWQKSEFNYLENDLFQAIDLPYGNGHFSMTIFLPNVSNSVETIISQMSQNQWQSWLKAFTLDSINVGLPKFKLEYKEELSKILTDLGMGIAFSGGADFSKLLDGGGIYISRVIHQSFLEVDEAGTEAAAATIVEMRETSAGGGPVEKFMIINRPFIFVIRDHHSQTNLFMGRVLKI